MGEFVIAAYRPKPGREKELLEVVRGHLPTLRRLGLVTDRPGYAMRAADGTLLEVFEWTSAEAVERAHHDPTVQEMWARFEAVCEYVPLASLEECARPFPGFEPVEL